jgi:hypothetical protein
MKARVHLRDLRLRNNAGIDFPACHAGARLLDMDKGRLESTGEASRVTCARCLAIVRREQARAEQVRARQDADREDARNWAAAMFGDRS